MSDIRGKRPRVLGARVAGLRLTPEEQLVLARIDGERSVAELAGMTGLAPERCEQIVSKLAMYGALDLDAGPRIPSALEITGIDDGGTTSLADFAAVLGMDPSVFAEQPAEEAPAPEAPRPPRRPKLVRRPEPYSPVPEPEPPAETDAPDPTLEPSPFGHVEEVSEREEHGGEEAPSPVEDASATDGLDASPEDARAAKDDEVARAMAERNYRQVYEARWHALSVDQRVAGAKAATGTDLLALCFDPDPRVIASILANASTGLDHVRLIAFHHRTTTGLEMISRRQDWLRDLLVERRLLRNPMIGEIVLGRVMSPKRLLPTYKVAIDRDVPELSRIKVRGMLKKKWSTAPSEERAELLLRTEARCLALMTGCTFDAKTTAILCGKPINSAMFVQSVAKFAASPPSLLAHLYKQPFVRKNPGLRKMLLAHPNMPGEVKRGV